MWWVVALRKKECTAGLGSYRVWEGHISLRAHKHKNKYIAQVHRPKIYKVNLGGQATLSEGVQEHIQAFDPIPVKTWHILPLNGILILLNAANLLCLLYFELTSIAWVDVCHRLPPN